MIDENRQTTEEYYYTRRMALESLVLFPSSLLTAVQFSPREDVLVEAFITQCAPCIMACSYLLKGDGEDLTTVEQMLPPYVSQLAKLAKSLSPFQKQAAFLAAQGYSLLLAVKTQQLQYDEALTNSRRVVEFAKVTGDRLLTAAALTRLAAAWSCMHVPESQLKAYQEAERLLPKDPEFFPARLRSCIYTGLSHAHAVLGHQREAADYLDIANKISLSPDDDLFIPVLTYDLSFKILTEGKICTKLGRLAEKNGSPDEAHSWYEKAAQVLAQPLPETTNFPEYIRVGIINRRALVAIKLENMKDFITFFEEGAKRSKNLGSKKKIKEAMRNLRFARNQWQYEDQVMQLDEDLL